MKHDVVMPKLAMGMSEGTVVAWKVAQGGRIEKGQALLEIETEKVSYEVEASETGVVNILTAVGETVPTYHVIAQIADSPAEFSTADSEAGAPAEPGMEASVASAAVPAAGKSPQGGRVVASPAAKRLAREHGVDLAQVTGSGPNGRIDKEDVLAVLKTAATETGDVKASPLAKKLAREHGIDLARVTGTGPNGKVGKEDVLAALEQNQPKTSAAETVSAGSAEPGVRATLPLRGVRGAIAANMMQSLASSAQLSLTVEYDATEIVKLRKVLLAQEEQLGVRISYLDIMAMIFARAAHRVPIVNSSIIDDEIKVWEDVNLGIAVATEINEYESGLFVPVLRNAGRKSLLELCGEIRELTGKVREGKLTPDLMQGGTMTLSSASMGSGMVMATPILTPGQAILVQPGMIGEKPVARDGAVVARSMLTVNYTFDHRIVDGVPIAKYSEAIRQLIECPMALIL